MDTRIKAVIAGAIVLGGLNTVVVAKTCECQQQKASATGKDSCSLTETKDYCNISFSGTTSSSRDNSGTMDPAIFDDMVKKLSGNRTIEAVLPDISFERLTLNKGDITGPELTGAAVTAIPPERASDVADSFGKLFEMNSQSLNSLVDQFNAKQCVEAKDGDFRVLVIAWNSKYDRSCEDK